MSQYQRHEDLAGQGSRRPQLPSSSSNPSTSIPAQQVRSRGPQSQILLNPTGHPRDQLSPRSDAEPSRKQKPSPLQSSHLPQSPLALPNHKSMPSKSNPYTSQPPIHHHHIQDQGGADTAETGNFGGSSLTSDVARNISNGIMEGPGQVKISPGTGNRPHRGQMVSPPDSPSSTTSSVRSENVPMRTGIPRGSSIDSGVSSISSSANHSNKPSIDAGLVSDAEMKSLISTAGSPENLIIQLLKEKRHAQTQNAQLWKLVDKQRQLLLGLNKDLEHLSKDKERYKKKLKEVQGQVPPLPLDAADRQSEVVTSSRAVTGAFNTNSLFDRDALAAKQLPLSTPDKRVAPHLESSPIDPSIVPSPLHTLQQQYLSKNASMPSEHADMPMSPSRTVPQINFPDSTLAASSGNSELISDRGFSDPSSNVDHTSSMLPPNVGRLQTSIAAPAIELIEPTPLNEKADKTFPSTKRTKPAPLNLNQSKRGSMLLSNMAIDDLSDSENEQTPEIDRQRGRRKTREEDDHDRQLAAQREQEARSRSKKEKSAGGEVKATDAKDDLAPPKIPISGLPQGPKPVMPQAQAHGNNARLAPPTAGGPDSQEYSTSQRLVVVPPMSPGLPMSPRPSDRPQGSALPRMPKQKNGVFNSLPMSPRGMPQGMPLSPRAPKQPIPLPMNVPLSAAFPPPPENQLLPSMGPNTGHITNASVQSANRVNEGQQNTVKQSPQVFRGYVDPTFPGLLLPPNALPSIQITVTSPRLHPPRSNPLKTQEESQVFVLSVHSRFDNKELWRCEKVVQSMPQLDQQFRALGPTSAKLPDRKLFSGHSPAVVDARRMALDMYFLELLDTPMTEKAARVICQFLSTDVIEPAEGGMEPSIGQQTGLSNSGSIPESKPKKSGYLTKRGKNFGGWKTRYFVVQGSDFRYFEGPGGAHLGTIKLHNAQIGKQSNPEPSQNEDDAENQYRHAFLILEPKRKDSSSLVRHVLCAETDKERDEWVEVLLYYVDENSDEDASNRGPSKRPEDGKSHVTGFESKMKMYASGSGKDDMMSSNSGPDELKAINYADTTSGPAPTAKPTGFDRQSPATPSPTSSSSATTPQKMADNDLNGGNTGSKMISAPTNGGVIHDAEAWGNKPVSGSNVKDGYHKKRGIWGFRHKSSTEILSPGQNSANESGSGNTAENSEPKPTVRAVFGLALAEAVEFCHPNGVDVNLPAVVYRCIEYLRTKNAASEEGIFRLSGSNVVVRNLKERFNIEGDVDFLADGQYYDVHAVASLFKSYLRELPTTVLTREFHLEFIRVLDLEDKDDKVIAFNTLVHRLPSVNFSLLRALSQYLLEVVNNSDKNKMGVRNVCIVFSPTLNIPAPVFTMFLESFEDIFGAPTSHPSPRILEIPAPTNLSPVDIRSPRHQMFSDLPTPAYNQTSFSRGPQTISTPTQAGGAPYRLAPGVNSTQDFGFTPLQPTYEARQYTSNSQAAPPNQSQPRMLVSQQPASQAGYASLNMIMSPENATSAKARRRESSLLMMGTSNRNGPGLDIRDDQNLST